MVENLITRRYFDQQAEDWACQPLPSHDRIHNLLKCLDFSRCRTILDLGCGTGVLFPFLYQLTQGTAQIFGCDFAESMTRLAAHRCRHNPIVICACATHLPFQDNSFDMIIAFQVLPHIQGKRLAFRECYRVLKPRSELGIMHLHSSWEINAIHRQIGGAVKNHRLPSGTNLAQMLKCVGFKIEAVEDQHGKYLVRAIKIVQ
ncbi:MAG: class I SAM-dependent methyltransferase [candidate division KSB1 bacterium]|nr:class I SAM-dependent methyltransferase [candidate division KSB1 bacterium]MDZ7336409.1 class I SAM-dependent methyltransferase [candidate division KSB1 bacterium]MDZ7358414.1 class I SAM-dependent methyltransferase [candidate division KSB1 bacterium]